MATLTLNYVLLRTRLVPRFIAVWGLIAAILVMVNQVVVVIVDHSIEFGPGIAYGALRAFPRGLADRQRI